MSLSGHLNFCQVVSVANHDSHHSIVFAVGQSQLIDRRYSSVMHRHIGLQLAFASINSHCHQLYNVSLPYW